MIAVRCTCSFSELADEEIADHLQQVFERPDSRGNDGLVHEEEDRLTCSCGLVASTAEALDGHFLKVFTPDDAIGRDGKRHEAALYRT
jgi:hypothetical protein